MAPPTAAFDLRTASRAFDAISAGWDHTCALAGTGEAYCWGYGGNGSLGYGGFNRFLVPVKVVTTQAFALVTAGASHTCGLTTGGQAACWGTNSLGQLGFIPTVETAQCTLGAPCTPLPVPVSGAITFVALDAGGHSTCGLDTGGRAYCWGENLFGELGNGTTDNGLTPKPVAGGHTFKTIRVGSSHACATTTSDDAYCWGLNSRGQLGAPSTSTCAFFQAYPCSLTPALVSGGLKWRIVDAGTAHSCGITTAGRAYCWGWNAAGQIGDGTNTDRPTPTAVATTATFTEIAAGDILSCGIDLAGAAICWAGTPAHVAAGFTWKSFTIGDNHRCAVATDGASYCGGRENNGELGQGGSHQDAVAFPTPVSAPSVGLVAPQARIVFACDGLTCVFDGSTSQDDRGIVSWAWTFGDGKSGTGPLVSHTWAGPSNQSVWLTVTDTDGLTSQTLTSLFDVNTTNRTPVVDFTIGSGPSCNGPLQVYVDATASTDPDGDPLAYHIDFGDGSTTTAPALCHGYATNATYVVTVRVRDAAFLVDAAKQVVLVPFGTSVSQERYTITLPHIRASIVRRSLVP
ncbi:MAG: PKD domain-containing protein [Gemmatimonadetes bacterium]|nr:PKD domain-containing protein [Gemmatimonadota bacterium]